MLEAYANLGYLAAVTQRVPLHTPGVVYRDPGLLAKMISTLRGAGGLGIGAA